MPTGRTFEIRIPPNERSRLVDDLELDRSVRAAVPECHGITVHRLHERIDGRETGKALVERIEIHVTGSRDGEPIKTALRKCLAEHRPVPKRTVNDALDAATPAERHALVERIVRERFGNTILKD